MSYIFLALFEALLNSVRLFIPITASLVLCCHMHDNLSFPPLSLSLALDFILVPFFKMSEQERKLPPTLSNSELTPLYLTPHIHSNGVQSCAIY